AYAMYVDSAKAPMPRNEMMELLQAKGIATRPGTHAVHLLELYRERLGVRADDFPVARDCNDNTMAIPLHNRMEKGDYNYVVDALHQI
ncbi:MAG: DegT/DnrJ/EryC1/StrS family aminotransferase, partial [Desulfuromonadales bacterium]|nr:DegT/DnrJ/EryC1/StrS family aminotransferase [Desulfuromonadales bacterium]